MPFRLTDSPRLIIDTTNSPLCTKPKNRDDLCVFAGTDIFIRQSVRVIGTKPLVLLATGSITTEQTGAIDVGSHRSPFDTSPEIGAGADPAACDRGTFPGLGAGGAGGNFAGFGGRGGDGSSGGRGGTPGPTSAIVLDLRGGCPGQNGEGMSGGVKGHGGGALLMIAGDHIDIRGGIYAGGEGGNGGAEDASAGGGGGGGSGGMIVFEAPTITANNDIIASGGGGGEGGAAGGAGFAGEDAGHLTGFRVALGGSGSTANGGIGGDGSDGVASAAGADGKTGGFMGGVGGGGGGGGGAGLIKAPRNASLGNRVFPSPTL